MTFWTDEKTEHLKYLYDQGLTGNEIAMRLGAKTRNMVIGKIDRLGLSGSSPSSRSVNKKTSSATSTQQIYRPKRYSSNKTCSTHGLDAINAKAPGVQFDDLKSHHCRWPIGTVGSPNFKFCGAHSDFGSSYCVEHTLISMPEPAARKKKERGYVSKRWVG